MALGKGVVGAARVVLGVEDNYSAGLRRARTDFHRTADDVDRAGGRMGRGFSALGTLAAGAAVGGVGLLAVALKRSVEEAAAHEKALAQTNAVLDSTQRVAGVSAEKILALADAIEKKSGMDDLAVQSGANLLLTFTNVRDVAGQGNDIFTQTTNIMADMSVALGQDASSSAIQLGKALNDPIKGVSALQRVGVSFTAAQKTQIKAMVEAGDVMGAQKLILRELNVEFGGSAKAAGETLPGKLNILKARIGDVQESIGKALLPTLTRLVERFSDWIERIQKSESAQRQLRAVMERVKEIAQGVADAVKEIAPKLATMARAIDTVVEKVGGWERAVKTLFALWAAAKVATMVASIGRLSGALAGIGGGANRAKGKGGSSGTGVLGLLFAFSRLPPAISIPIVLTIVGWPEVKSTLAEIEGWLQDHGIPWGRKGRGGPGPPQVPTGPLPPLPPGVTPIGASTTFSSKYKATFGTEEGNVGARARGFANALAGAFGKNLDISSGRANHGKYTASGNVSEHYSGNAVDIPASGDELTQLGRVALILAGMDPAQARRATQGSYNINGYQVIFNMPDHWDHLHVGVGRALGDIPPGLKQFFDRTKAGKKGTTPPPATGADPSAGGGGGGAPAFGYVPPVKAGTKREQTDRGVDFQGNPGDYVVAIGDAEITFAGRSGGFGQLVVYRLLDGPREGQHVFVGHAWPLVKKGDRVKAGTPVAQLMEHSSGIRKGSPHERGWVEIGFAANPRGRPVAEVESDPGLVGNKSTRAGRSFGQFLRNAFGYGGKGSITPGTTGAGTTTTTTDTAEPTIDEDVAMAMRIDKLIGSRPMRGLGAVMVQAGKKYGVDPRFIAAVAGAETEFGRTGLGRASEGNNAFGFIGYRFGNYTAAIYAFAKLMATGTGSAAYFTAGKTNVGDIIARYSPVGAANDPKGTNAQHPANIASILKGLGGDPSDVTFSTALGDDPTEKASAAAERAKEIARKAAERTQRLMAIARAEYEKALARPGQYGGDPFRSAENRQSLAAINRNRERLSDWAAVLRERLADLTSRLGGVGPDARAALRAAIARIYGSLEGELSEKEVENAAKRIEGLGDRLGKALAAATQRAIRAVLRRIGTIKASEAFEDYESGVTYETRTIRGEKIKVAVPVKATIKGWTVIRDNLISAVKRARVKLAALIRSRNRLMAMKRKTKAVRDQLVNVNAQIAALRESIKEDLGQAAVAQASIEELVRIGKENDEDVEVPPIDPDNPPGGAPVPPIDDTEPNAPPEGDPGGGSGGGGGTSSTGDTPPAGDPALDEKTIQDRINAERNAFLSARYRFFREFAGNVFHYGPGGLQLGTSPLGTGTSPIPWSRPGGYVGPPVPARNPPPAQTTTINHTWNFTSHPEDPHAWMRFAGQPGML